jgi:hypothetical protein
MLAAKQTKTWMLVGIMPKYDPSLIFQTDHTLLSVSSPLFQRGGRKSRRFFLIKTALKTHGFLMLT